MPLSTLPLSKLNDWQALAERRLKKILKITASIPTLRRLVQGKDPWVAEVTMVGSSRMRRLNALYRKKDSVTDVISFPAPALFQKQGQLGELVICLPRMKSQAVSVGNDVRLELDILLIHGCLHLLGLDHELGPRQAREMAKWELRVLAEIYPKKKLRAEKKGRKIEGLIQRTRG